MKTIHLIILWLLASTIGFAQPNIAKDKIVTASNTHNSSNPQNIVDGNKSTGWNSGGGAPQWITIDLGGKYDVSKIKLVPSQSPNGNTTHEILVSNDLTNWLSVDKFTLNTSDNVPIVRNYPSVLNNIRAVKVLTSVSPSWVAWYDIEVYGVGSGNVNQDQFFYNGYKVQIDNILLRFDDIPDIDNMNKVRFLVGKNIKAALNTNQNDLNMLKMKANYANYQVMIEKIDENGNIVNKWKGQAKVQNIKTIDQIQNQIVISEMQLLFSNFMKQKQ